MSIATTVDSSFAGLLGRITNARQKLSLERLKSACDYLEENGIRITPAKIEAYCVDRKWDGPKAQSIRNSKEVLKWYVDLRSSGQKVQRQSPSRASEEPVIADESIRAYVRLLKEERDQAVSSRVRIESGLRSIPGVPIDDLIRGSLSPGALPLPARTANSLLGLTPIAMEALRGLFDEERLRSCGLELFRDRILHVTTRNVLLEKAEVEALRALVKTKP